MPTNTNFSVPSEYFILAARRVIKLLANLSKLACYIFHAIRPRKRFLIPQRAPALRAQSIPSEIPRTIWQTNFTGRVTLPVYLNYLFNRLMAPEFEHRFMVTQEREAFIRESFPPKIFNAYSRIQIGAAQADFWRLLVLQKFGGVYMDIDAHLVWPLHKILGPQQQELFLQIKTGEISNYFIASKPNNPNLAALIEQVCVNIETNASPNVYDLTGPGVFNKVLASRAVPTRYYLYTCNQGNFTNEYFQYIDKPQGKWTKEQKRVSVLRDDANE
jgi:mannosyltransferase OCH1-like enzyme